MVEKKIVHPDSIEAELKRRELVGFAPLTQQEMMTDAGQECLRLGIDLAKYKQAFAEQMLAWVVADRLTGETADYTVHWAVHGQLRNWMRATFPQTKIRSWPYGNWWTIQRSLYNPKDQTLHRDVVHLVIK